jgi:diguanylate cyclase (GGDEF)-like protein
MDINNINNILIIGGGRRGLATIEILSEYDNINIIAVVDKSTKAAGIKLAQRLEINTDSEWEKYLKGSNVPDIILNLTDNSEIQKCLHEKAAGKNIEILGNFTSQLLGSLLMERQAQIELHRVSKKITTDVDLDELMILLLSACVKSTKASGGTLLLFDNLTLQWEIKSNWGVPENLHSTILESFNENSIDLSDKDEAIEFSSGNTSDEIPEELKFAICAPLKARNNLIGAIVITQNTDSDKFTLSTKRLLSTFANQSAVAVDNTLLYKQTEHLSVTDGLTGLYNHRYFQEQMQTELRRAQRYDLNFSVIMVDIDNFKTINDTYGHLAGDELLKKIAVHLKQVTRDTDTVARYGGDEFVILLPETVKNDSLIVAERIRSQLQESKIAGNIQVEVSIGIAAYPDDGVYSKDIVSKADSALYKAKEEGRNRVIMA